MPRPDPKVSSYIRVVLPSDTCDPARPSPAHGPTRPNPTEPKIPTYLAWHWSCHRQANLLELGCDWLASPRVTDPPSDPKMPPPALSRSSSACVDLDFTLRRQFNKTAFRPHQRDIITAALEGRDVFVQAATSFGKSLCFQLPACIDQGITIVVSPLLSLMVSRSIPSILPFPFPRCLVSCPGARRPGPPEKCRLGIRACVGSPLAPQLGLLGLWRLASAPVPVSTNSVVQMNQVEQLRAAKINASSLNSYTLPAERDRINRDLATGHPLTRLLYVTPELCSTDGFRSRLELVNEQCELARVVVDEAHCISEWGHDFRRDFKRLSWFRQRFPKVPIMCLTATANPLVRQDILSTLGLSGDGVAPDRLSSFVMTAHRPNLHLEIRYTKDQEDRMSDFLAWIRAVHERRAAEPRKAELEAEGESHTVSGIIYTMSRDECESLAAQLVQEGIGARPFHAKLSKEVKEQTLSRWVDNQPGYDIIVATTAFGMGIDKENVRFVVHWRLPKSFEGYYQEAGRAGRDGNASYCFLYYSREDLQRAQSLVRRGSREAGSGTNSTAQLKSLQALALYCENTGSCRHAQICRYFGETETPKCDYACDWHKDPHGLQRRLVRGLADEHWVSTQAEIGRYEGGYHDD